MQSWPAMDSDRRSFDGTEPADPSDQQGSQSARHARSYDCSFCKRGFSNAQALGGHMNIHRKDRARLKQPYGQTLLSFQLPADEVSAPFPASYMAPPLHAGGGDDGGGYVSMAPWIAPQIDTHGRRSTHALFDENPSRRFDMPWGGRGGGDEDMEGSGRGPAEAAELDLELRLGFESPDATSTGFKEFI